jgi:hypothetical protein
VGCRWYTAATTVLMRVPYRQFSILTSEKGGTFSAPVLPHFVANYPECSYQQGYPGTALRLVESPCLIRADRRITRLELSVLRLQTRSGSDAAINHLSSLEPSIKPSARNALSSIRYPVQRSKGTEIRYEIAVTAQSPSGCQFGVGASRQTRPAPMRAALRARTTSAPVNCRSR